MILKVLKYIAAKRIFAFAFLLLPMFAGIFMAPNSFVTSPASSFTYVELTFSSPGKMARDLEFQVAEKVEKTLNGIQGLISFEAEIKHEYVIAKLMFDNSNDEDKIRLFLQEKLDILKIQLGSLVQDTDINFIRPSKPSLILLKMHESKLTPNEWSDWNLLSQEVRQVYPKVNNKESIKVVPIFKKLIQYGMGLDQLTSAIRLKGLTYQLGNKHGKAYLLDGRASDVEELGQTIVAAKGHRIIKLKDVCSIEKVERVFPSQIELWPDENQSYSENSAFIAKLKDKFPQAQVVDLRPHNLWHHVDVHLFEILSICGIFAFLFWPIFKNAMAISSVFVFTLFFSSHFIFWLSVFNQEISSLQFEALNLSLIMGLFIWGIYLARIRTYFLANNLELFIKRTLEQAIFFTYVEFLPTLIALVALLGVFALPVLMGSWSPYSKEIIQIILFISVPLIFFLLFIMCLLTPLKWLEGKNDVLTLKFPNRLKGDLSLYALIPFLLILLLSPLIKEKIKYRLEKNTISNQKTDWISHFRGYNSKLTYFLSSDDSSNTDKFSILEKTQWENIFDWWVTPNGLQQIIGRGLIPFQKSLEDFSQNNRVMNLEDGIPIQVSFPQDVAQVDFGHMIISGQDGKAPVYLKQIAAPSLSRSEKSIYRSQMDRRVLVSSNRDYEFPVDDSKIFSHTARTILIENEFSAYKRNFWSVVLFSFLILSLYFNSFIRGGLALVYSQVFLTLPGLIAWIFNRPLPVDSIHLSLFVAWFPICALMFLSRSIDIERLRGNEKNDSVVQLTNYFNDTFIWMSVGVTATFCIMPLISRFKSQHSLAQILVDGQDYYGVFILVAMALLLLISFRLFYTSTERHLDRVILLIARIYYKRKSQH